MFEPNGEYGIVPVIAGMLLFLTACGGGTGSDESLASSTDLSVTSQSYSRAAAVEADVLRAAAAPSIAAAESGVGRVTPGMALQTVQRKVISSASVSIKVSVVVEVVVQIRAIAEGMGGFVEQLSSAGTAGRQQASLTIRVPQDQFFTALERIEALGEVQSKNLGSEDVSEQFIDLESRLKSSLREEESLLSLLGRSATVSEVLTIERELTRIRPEIERVQGQLNFLERRVALATIMVSLFPPRVPLAMPPSGTLSMEVEDVNGSLEEAKGLVVGLEGAVEQVFISVRDGKERADVTLMVRPEDFNRVMDFLEAQGKVKIKEIREGSAQVEQESGPDQSSGGTGVDGVLDARIELSFLEEDDTLGFGLIIGIIVAVLILAVLGFIFRSVYVAGVRSTSYR